MMGISWLILYDIYANGHTYIYNTLKRAFMFAENDELMMDNYNDDER